MGLSVETIRYGAEPRRAYFCRLERATVPLLHDAFVCTVVPIIRSERDF